MNDCMYRQACYGSFHDKLYTRIHMAWCNIMPEKYVISFWTWVTWGSGKRYYLKIWSAIFFDTSNEKKILSDLNRFQFYSSQMNWRCKSTYILISFYDFLKFNLSDTICVHMTQFWKVPNHWLFGSMNNLPLNWIHVCLHHFLLWKLPW
jgi:hypothetical protein